MAEKMIVTLCPKCGTTLEIKKGLFKTACHVCHEKYSYDEVAVNPVLCHSCGKVVEQSAVNDNLCPACHGPVDPELENRVIDCPICTLPVTYRRGATSVTCLNPRCRKVFNPTERYDVLTNMHSNDAPDIRMTEDIPADQLVWQAKLDSKNHSISLEARVHASSGFYALARQGNTTKFVVDGQSVLLSETDLRYDAFEYEGGLAPEVIVDIFYLRRSFSAQFKWGYSATVGDQYGMKAQYMLRGTVEIDYVSDPSLFFDAFCAKDPQAVRASDFAVIGMGDPGEYAKTLRSEVNGVLQQAMLNLRDDRGYACTDMKEHWQELRAEILRLANEAVAKYGVCLRNLEGTIDAPTTTLDVLQKRLGGPIDWKLSAPVMAHRADDAAATVELMVDGSLRVEVVDENRLNATMEGNLWRDPSKDDDIARRDIAAQAAGELMGRLEADINLLVFETKCDINTINSFQGSLRQRGLAELNKADGFFQRHGLKVCDMVVMLRMGQKSAIYSRYEKMAENISFRGIESKEDDAATDAQLHADVNTIRRGDSAADVKASAIRQNEKIEQAKFEAEQAKLQRQATLDTQRRAMEFEAWREDQRRAEAEAEAAYARARRDQLEKQQGELKQAEHEVELFAIAQRIEESKLSWREKLDAYARLQRGVAFRDAMEEREAAGGVAEREQRIQMQLRTQELETLERLSHEEALHEEELAKQRFARELELRRQMMAEEAAKLQAQYEQLRMQAAEQEKRHAAEDEIQTLRLMLEYLAKSGAQQVTQEALRNARENAETKRQEARAQEERKAAEARANNQESADRAMATRAMELMSQMAAMKTGLSNGGKTAEADSVQKVIDQLASLTNAIKTNAMPVFVPANHVDMNSWFQNMTAQANAGTPAFNAVAPAAGMVQCIGCGKPFSAGMFKCPHCNRIV